MQRLPTVDVVVLLLYVAAVVGFGCWFVRRSRTTEGFTAAGRSLPGWAVGLSIFGTYLSSNTFLGVPGKAYGSNWSFFVFSLSLPIAAVIAVRFFVPFYRRSGEISAYQHLERRFGPWARIYAVVCYLLTQLARVGTIMYGVALALNALIGWDMATIIVVTGVLVTFYTLLGGIEAVIWTDVAQSVILAIGAFVIVGLLLFGTPGGPAAVFSVAAEHGKFSLGSPQPSLMQETFWVVLIYGLVMNLNNFGVDQSFIQRYHTAKGAGEAARSVWMCAALYLPISAVFFFIGSCLWVYYQHEDNAAMLDDVRRQKAAELLAAEADVLPDDVGYEAALAEKAEALESGDVGDKVFPHFIANNNRLPPGAAGLLIAALFAAAMSSIDTSLNSSATILLADVYRRYVRPGAGERESMRVLYAATLAVGAAGTGVAVAMIGQKSVLEAWWKLSGIFAGGMLGLFLLGLASRRARNSAAIVAVVVGVLVIGWMSLSLLDGWPENLQPLRSPLHEFMIPVVGTLTILLVGLVVSRAFGTSERS